MVVFLLLKMLNVKQIRVKASPFLAGAANFLFTPFVIADPHTESSIRLSSGPTTTQSNVKTWSAIKTSAIANTDSDEEDEKKIDALINDLKNSNDAEVRKKAISELSRSQRIAGLERVTIAFIEALKDKEPIIRAIAANELSYLRFGEKEKIYNLAVKALIELLVDTTPAVRENAAYALGNIGEYGSRMSRDLAVKALLEALKNDKDPEVRKHSVSSLGSIRIGSEEIVNALIRTFQNDNSVYVRMRAARIIAREIGRKENSLSKETIESGAKILTEALKNNNSELRRELVIALDQLNYISSKEAKDFAIRALVEVLQNDSEENIRERTAITLGEIGKDSTEAVKALIQALGDKSKEVQKESARALGRIDNISNKEIKSLAINALIVVLLQNKNEQVQFLAVRSLRTIGTGSQEAVKALIEVLKDKDSGAVKVDSVDALGEIGMSSQEAIDILIIAFKDNDFLVRRNAVNALSKIGKGSPEEVNALIYVIQNDEDRYVQRNAVSALGNIGKKSSNEIKGLLIKILIEAIKNHSFDEVRARAAGALGQVGKGSPEEISVLIEALKDKEGFVRKFAAEALGKIGKGLPEEIAVLINKILKDAEASVRDNAVIALGNIGKSSFEEVSVLIGAALQDEEAYVRASAIKVLGEIGKSLKEKAIKKLIINALVTALNDSDPDVQILAHKVLIDTKAIPHLIQRFKEKEGTTILYLLADIGQDAVPDLLQALNDPDEVVRANSAQALGLIGKEKIDVLKIAKIEKELKALLKDKSRDVRKSSEQALKLLNTK